MKKIFLLSGALIFCALASQAQISLGVKLGSGVSNQSRNDVQTSKLLSNSAFKTYHIGLVAEMPITGNIYLQPQLLYAKKGVRYTGDFGTDAKLTLHNIELPVNILYKMDMPFGKLFAGAGPVLSYGFSGKLQNNGQTKNLYSGEQKNWNRLDISANALAGISFNNGFFASIAYQRGFRDLYKTAATDAKNRSVSLSIGYMINRKKPNS